MVGTHAIGTATAIVGLVASTGTQTAAADGTVDVYMPLPGIIYRDSLQPMQTLTQRQN